MFKSSTLVNKTTLSCAGLLLAASLFAPSAQALNLDWSGYFRADDNYVHGVDGESSKSSNFSDVFMRLKPRILVNDNVIVHSEWNVGDPVAGFFGRSIPEYDRNNALSTEKATFDLGVSRLWLDVHTDFGTIQAGRAPFHWGLGAIFNSGDGPFDRFQSTSDTIRLISKFGYLSLMPLYAKNSMGRSLAGSRTPIALTNPNTPADGLLSGNDDVTDFGVGLKYENPEEELEAGALYYKRSAGDSQTSYYYPQTSTATGDVYTPGANGMNLRLINIYAKKAWKHLSLGAELPIWSGEVGDVNGIGARNNYSATALAFEAALKYDTWKHTLKAGLVPGQDAVATGNHGDSFGEMSFHRAYKLGLILFNYNLAGFGAANPDHVPGDNPTGNNLGAADRTVSPYDASITNAHYVMLATEKHWEQWGVNAAAIWAEAGKAAVAGSDFYSTISHRYYTATSDQGKSLGLEIDLGGRYNWDDNISFGLDAGILFPGSYLKYNDPTFGSGLGKNVAAISLSAATVF